MSAAGDSKSIRLMELYSYVMRDWDIRGNWSGIHRG